MKTKLCQFCLKSGILCPKCKEKIKKEEVTSLDIKIARLLLSIEDECPALQNVYFHKAVEANNILAIFFGKGDLNKILSCSGKIIKFLENKTGKIIHILEYDSGERKFLEDLFAPLTVLTINKIWLPDGSVETKVILRGGGRRKDLANIEALKEIARKVRGIRLRIEFAKWR